MLYFHQVYHFQHLHLVSNIIDKLHISHACTHTHRHTHAHTQTHTDTHAHTCTHAHTHTHLIQFIVRIHSKYRIYRNIDGFLFIEYWWIKFWRLAIKFHFLDVTEHVPFMVYYLLLCCVTWCFLPHVTSIFDLY